MKCVKKSDEKEITGFMLLKKLITDMKNGDTIGFKNGKKHYIIKRDE